MQTIRKSLQSVCNNGHHCAVVIASLLFAHTIYAQDLSMDSATASRDFRGFAQLDASYTDNFYYATNPGRGVAGLRFQSDLSYIYALPRFRFAAVGGIKTAGFDIDAGANAYVDGHVNLSADWKAAERHGFQYLVSSVFGHDPFGTQRTAGGLFNNAELDHWRALSMGGKYTYGTVNDPIGVELRLDGTSKQYTTNTAVTQFLDYGAVTGGVTALYNYSPKTAFLVDFSANQTNFDLPPPAAFPSFILNYNEYRVMAGVRWAATAKTSGDVRVGYFNHRPKDGSIFESVSSVDWQANAKWAPLATRTFTLTAGRSSIPSYLSTVSFINNHEVSATWREDWTEKFTTKLTTGYALQEFNESARHDDGFSVDTAVEYRLAQSISLVGNVTYTFRNSNDPSVEFNRFVTYAGVRVSF